MGLTGNAVLRRFRHSIAEIRVFSEDEKKQHDMRQVPTISYVFASAMSVTMALRDAMTGVDYVFHAAA